MLGLGRKHICLFYYYSVCNNEKNTRLNARKKGGAWFKMSFFTKSQSRDAYIWITQAGVDRLSTFAGFCFCLSEVPRRKQTVCHWADRKLMPAIPQERCLPITLKKKNKEKRLTCLKRRVLTYFRVNFFQD